MAPKVQKTQEAKALISEDNQYSTLKWSPLELTDKLGNKHMVETLDHNGRTYIKGDNKVVRGYASKLAQERTESGEYRYSRVSFYQTKEKNVMERCKFGSPDINTIAFSRKAERGVEF